MGKVVESVKWKTANFFLAINPFYFYCCYFTRRKEAAC